MAPWFSNPVDWMNLQHGTLKFGVSPWGNVEELILHQRSALGHSASDLVMTHGILAMGVMTLMSSKFRWDKHS